MNICLAKENDALQIAEIHQQEIKKGFLNTLNKNFLARIYSAIIESKDGSCVVAEKNKEIVGFIAGTTNLDRFYFYFLKKYFFQAVFFLFPEIFSFKKIKKIIEVIFYPEKEKDLPKAELLTIAIKNQFQGQGIAGQMFERFVVEMKSRGVDNFKVVVGEKLLPAIKFYEKNGFKFIKNINIHSKELSRVYIYQIK